MRKDKCTRTGKYLGNDARRAKVFIELEATAITQDARSTSEFRKHGRGMDLQYFATIICLLRDIINRRGRFESI